MLSWLDARRISVDSCEVRQYNSFAKNALIICVSTARVGDVAVAASS